MNCKSEIFLSQIILEACESKIVLLIVTLINALLFMAETSDTRLTVEKIFVKKYFESRSIPTAGLNSCDQWSKLLYLMSDH